MGPFDSSTLDDLARRLADSVPPSLRNFGRDLESNFKAVLQAQLSRLNLVSRQDFEVQSAILERTQARLAELETRLKELEAENTRLRRAVSDLTLDKLILQEAARGNY